MSNPAPPGLLRGLTLNRSRKVGSRTFYHMKGKCQMTIAISIILALLVKNEIISLLTILYISVRVSVWLFAKIIEERNYL